MKLPLLSATAALFLGLALAHGPALSAAELQKREQHHLQARRSFAACQDTLLKKRSENYRREEFVQRYQEKRYGAGNEKRQNNEPTRTQKNIATGTNTANPFRGIPTCVLAPETVQGPYYLPGELIRDDIRESEPGVDLLLDVQVFDARSCEVMPNVMVDFWHANSTGTYSGYRVEGTESETWLRGLAETDDEGLVQVTTKWPGHYSGRAVHIHIMAHVNGTIRTQNNNGREERTYVGGSNPYVGQIFFPMDAIDRVEATEPYSNNEYRLVRNDEDSIFNRMTDAVEGFDGLADIRRLGRDVADGYLAWISIGIDTGNDHDTGFPDDESRDEADESSSGGSRTTTTRRNTVNSPTFTSTVGGNVDSSGAQDTGSVFTAGKIIAVGMGVVAVAAFWA